MAFPQSPLAHRGELLIDGAWVDITSGDYGIRGDSGVRVVRGRKNEHGRVTPTECNLTLKDPLGKYNPDNPLSEYYGSIGPNQRFRYSAGLTPILDENFNYTASNTWAGGTVSFTTSGGAASDFDVNGTKGTITHTDVGTLRYAYTDCGQDDHRIDVHFNIGAADITGGAASIWIVARMTDTDNFYTMIVNFSASESITGQLWKRVGGVATSLGNAGTLLGSPFTGAANQNLIASLYVVGKRIYANLSLVSTGNILAAWDLTAIDEDLPTGSNAGVTGRRETGNSNSNLPFEFDNILIVPGAIEATVEIPNLGASRWDETGRNVRMPIQGSGIMRRLGTAAGVFKSPLYRAHSALSPVAWWPMEDGTEARRAESGVDGVASMEGSSLHSYATAGTYVEFGQSPPTDAGVAALCDLKGGGTLHGRIPRYAETGLRLEIAMQHKLGTADSGGVESTPITWFSGPADDTQWIWSLKVNNAHVYFSITTLNPVATQVEITYANTGMYDGQLHHFAIEANQAGSDVSINLIIDGVSRGTDTWASHTLSSNPVRDAVINYAGSIGAAGATADFMPAVSHVAVYAPIPNSPNTAEAALAHIGETAGERFVRLCDEENIDYEILGTAEDTARMGPQRIATLLQLLQDCEDADLGILHEPRAFFGLAFRTGADLYNQYGTGPAFDYTSKHLSGEPYPDPDDLLRGNDVIAARPNGSEFRVIQETGAMSISHPPNGIGQYQKRLPAPVESDGQLPDIASWGRNIGTWGGPRYPTIGVGLHRAPVVADVTLTNAVVRLDIGDYFSVDNMPSGTTGWLSPDLVELLCQGYSKVFMNRTAECTFNSVPAGPYRVAIRGSSYSDGRVRDSLATVLGEALDTTETGVDVTVTGPLWVTGSVDFDIMVGGELMSVSSISGSSSPQTFTVTRSVNGIVKSHATGAEVHVFPAARRALSGPDVNDAVATPAVDTIVRGRDTPQASWAFGGLVTDTTNTFKSDDSPIGTSFVAPSTGTVMIRVSANMDHSASGTIDVGYEVRQGGSLGEGTLFAQATVARSVSMIGQNDARMSKTFLAAGLTPGKTYNAVLQHRTSGATASISRRMIFIAPVGTQGGLPGTYIQGEPAASSALDDASGTSTSASFTATGTGLASLGTSFVAAASGRALIHISSKIDLGSNVSGLVSYRVGTGSTIGAGTEIVAASDTRSITSTNVEEVTLGRTFSVTGLTPGSTYNVQLQHRVTGGGTVTLQYRNVAVEPVT